MADEISKKQKFNSTMTRMFIILPIIITIVVMVWPDPPKPPGGTSTVTTNSHGQIDTQQKGTGSGVRYKHIVAPVFPEWSREINTREYDWSCDKDMAAGLSNMNNLIAVKYKNDNGIQIAYEERLPDGRIADLYIPNANADWVRVSSLETYPVSSLVTLTKKSN